ncbi:MAG: insulinase family protein [Akkermansiaceae bacterium]|nr:insulinase family protein [Akkermansiaceae bacterium]
MKSLIVLATALVFPLSANPVAGEGSDLKPDPKAVFGSLDNGFNYIVYPNAEPPGQFSVRLHIAAGSLMENDNQRGLAHFLEHMVFNGSKNFTPDELIPKMQRLGIAFGAHANAYTSFDETVYMLDLPNLDKETVDLTFTVMRDFADGALLLKDEIDKERGVIISEKTSRDSVGYRMMLKQFEYLLPGSRLMQRVPIGTEEVIKGAPRERFTEFYSDFYTPSRMTFVVVGDFKAEEMEKRVRETFISMTNPEKAGKNPLNDTPPSGHGFRTEVFTDKEISSDDLTLYNIRPHTLKTDTEAERLSGYPLSLAHSILNRRFDVLAKEEGSPILGGGANRSVLFNQIEQGGLAVSPAENKWEAAIPVMEQELRRALLHGFTQTEVDEAKARYINAAEQSVKRAPTRESAGLAMGFIGSIGKKSVFTTPDTNLELAKKGLAKLTPANCHKAFQKFWDTNDLSFVLTSRRAEDGTANKLKKLYLESSKVEVTAPEQEALTAFSYTDFGKAGTIVKQNDVEDFEATQLILSNNIRVNFKQTDFAKNSISLSARFGSGQLTQPKDAPGMDRFASMVFQGGGLGKHSEDELQRILAGRNVGVGFGIGEGDFSLGGRTTPEDLELQLQLMCAYLTDPGFRPEAERMFKMALPMIYKQLEHSMQGAMVQMGSQLYGGDDRFEFPPQEKALTYNTNQVKGWLLPQIKDSYLELTIVGDFDKEKLVPFILKTFGALPARKESKPDYAERRRIYMPSSPGRELLNFDSKIPNAAAVAVWKIPATGDNIKRSRRFNILSSILSDRMREEIREKLGGSYSPRAGAAPSQVLDFGMMRAMAQVKPEETKKYGELMIKLAHIMAQKGVTQDELERSLKPLQSNLKESLRDNGYWLGSVLGASQEKPHVLDWARTRDGDYAAVTVEELNALAKEFLTKDNALLYELVPKESKKKEER